MADPLVEILTEFCEGTVYDPGEGYAEERATKAAAAVRAHLAGVLDAEREEWPGMSVTCQGARLAINNLRAALGVASLSPLPSGETAPPHTTPHRDGAGPP